MQKEQYLTLSELQDLIKSKNKKVSNTTLPRYARLNKIPGLMKVGDNKQARYFISIEDAEKYANLY